MLEVTSHAHPGQCASEGQRQSPLSGKAHTIRGLSPRCMRNALSTCPGTFVRYVILDLVVVSPTRVTWLSALQNCWHWCSLERPGKFVTQWVSSSTVLSQFSGGPFLCHCLGLPTFSHSTIKSLYNSLFWGIQQWGKVSIFLMVFERTTFWTPLLEIVMLVK